MYLFDSLNHLKIPIAKNYDSEYKIFHKSLKIDINIFNYIIYIA